MVSTSRILELYYAVRLTFKGNYDFFKYQGKLGKAYDGESSRYYSALLRIQKKFNTEARIIKHFAICNIERDCWLTDCSDERNMYATSEYEKQERNLSEDFRRALDEIEKNYNGVTGLKRFIKETEFNAPMLSMLLGGKINISTFLFIDIVTEASSHWDSRIWKHYKLRVEKVKILLSISNIDKIEIKNQIFDVFKVKQYNS